MKIAFATQDMQRVDAHFNGARQFAVYQVSADQARFVEAVQFEDNDGDGDTRIMAKIDAIRDCTMLFVAAIGGPAAAKVVKSRIHPIKARENETINDILDRLKVVLAGDPPPWLRKVLRPDEERDLSFLEEDEDDDF